MTYNQNLITGLWKCRNRETDTTEQRRQIRNWLRQSIKLERKRRS